MNDTNVEAPLPTPPPAPEHKGLPKVLKVCGKRFKVSLVANLDNGQNLGSADSRKQLVELDPDQGFDNIRETLVHETVHAIDESLVLGLTERQVQGLGLAILNVLLDNHHLVRFLTMPNPVSLEVQEGVHDSP